MHDSATLLTSRRHRALRRASIFVFFYVFCVFFAFRNLLKIVGCARPAECAVPAGGKEGCISMHNPPGFAGLFAGLCIRSGFFFGGKQFLSKFVHAENTKGAEKKNEIPRRPAECAVPAGGKEG